MPPPSIIAVKQAFLDRETRQLAQPLAPSRAWRRAHDSRTRRRQSEEQQEGGARRLPDKAVDDALARVNQLLQQHARRVYAPQATRHVAEQLDQLYWQATDLPTDQSGRDHLDWSRDLAHPDALAALPAAWDEDNDSHPLEARRYAELVARARDLAARRAEAAARVQRLRRLAALVAPLRAAPAQDSLVTRDGPVERELERMRLLLARVGDRVAALPPAEAKTAAATMDDVEAVGQQRVQALLERF